ncbi:MAG: hypothetical protein KA073_00440 [Aliarcobacter sp.]|nr:hypothetical protein [Aliarcobacter sp.]
MILIGLFLIIALVVISLNLHNQFNLDEIEEYLQKNNCKNIVYSAGSYKALCDDYFISIENSFTVDINKNSKIINYEEIKNIQLSESEILINRDNKIKFKNEEKLNLFFKDLEKKLNQ